MFGFFKKNQVEKEVPVFALAGGEIVPITQVNDPVFAGKMMGDGFAVIPASGVITSPVKGEVVNVFPTLHAVGIQTAGGLEVLVHMGIDTVELKGEGFTRIAQEGQSVKRGDTVIEFDLATLESKAKSVLTPVVISNMDEISSIEKKSGEVIAGESVVLSLTK